MLFSRLTPSALLAVIALVECGFALGALATAAANRTSEISTQRARWLKFGTYFLIVHLVLVAAAFGHPWFTFLIGAIVLGGAFEIAHVSRERLRNRTNLPAIGLAILVYSLLAAGCMVFSLISSPGKLVFVYVIVAVLDAYSQLTGQLFGRHKIAPKISSKKTIEGALGGTAAATLAACILHQLGDLRLVEGAMVGLCLSCAGIVGDLSASWFKRVNGVENYSAVLPGQGGIIDRFNSLLCAAPVSLVLTFLHSWGIAR
jgi:phosphatidate cytidylyltransferase